MTTPFHQKRDLKIVISLICLHLIVRLYQLTTPLADWHSFRQADTVSVAREYVKHGLDLLRPRYHDLSNIQSGQANPEGFRMVELPLVQGVVAVTYKPLVFIIPTLDLHVWYRLTSLIFSTFSLLLLMAITSHLFSPFMGYLSGLLFALLPYNIYYSRAIFPEVAMTTTVLLSLFYGLRYHPTRQLKFLYLSGIAAAVALLIKPPAAFFLLPLLYLFVLDFLHFPRLIGHWLTVAVISITPMLFWRTWITHYPQGIPASRWLLNGNGIRLRPAWFRWLLYERLTKLILGYTGLLPFLLGLYQTVIHSSPSQAKPTHTSLMAKLKASFRHIFPLAKPLNPYLFVGIWLIGGLLYLIVFATGNVQHDYYHIPQIPAVIVVMALGLTIILGISSKSIKSVLLIGCGLSFIISWQTVETYYHVNHWAIVHAGQVADHLLPPQAKVIAPYMGDTAFLYQTNRTGWPIGYDIDTKISQGAEYYVSVNYDDEARVLESRYQTITKTPEFIILNLTQPLENQKMP